jgi:hypothetical protein
MRNGTNNIFTLILNYDMKIAFASVFFVLVSFDNYLTYFSTKFYGVLDNL